MSDKPVDDILEAREYARKKRNEWDRQNPSDRLEIGYKAPPSNESMTYYELRSAVYDAAYDEKLQELRK